MHNPQFQIFRNATTNEYFYQLISGRREIIIIGEGPTKQSCLKAIASVKKNSVYDSRFDRFDNAHSFSFSLKSTNRVVVGKSITYDTAAARELAIKAVACSAPKALVIEMR